MRALLAAVGTRGDVQPALALALELRKLGHEVRLCISPNFVDWAKRLGLEAIPMGVEMRIPSGKSGPAPSLTPEELRRLRESMPDLITDQFETIDAAGGLRRHPRRERAPVRGAVDCRASGHWLCHSRLRPSRPALF